MRELDQIFMERYKEFRQALLLGGVTMAEYFKTLSAPERLTMQKIRNYRNQLAFSYPMVEASEQDVTAWLATLNQALKKIA